LRIKPWSWKKMMKMIWFSSHSEKRFLNHKKVHLKWLNGLNRLKRALLRSKRRRMRLS
jgi:hypothetical protein